MGHYHHAKPARDVALVKKQSICYWQFYGDSKCLVINNKPQLSVLAVVGPAESKGKTIPEAVLLEIGVGKTRPYKQSRLFPLRLPFFPLSAHDYQKVAPDLFKHLAGRAATQVAKRKSGSFDNPFYLTQTRHLILKQRQGVIRIDKRMVREPRVVFSASVHDKWLIRDLLHAELFLNKTLQRQLHGLGRYIDKLLSYHRKGSVKLDPSRLGDSQFFYEAKLALEGWPRYLQVETLLHYLPGKRGNFYFSELCQLIGLDPATISDTQERMLAEEALPEVEKRLGTIQIRLVPRKEKLKPDTLVNRRIPHQYVVFEVFPVKPEWITVESDRKTLFTDEIPF